MKFVLLAVLIIISLYFLGLEVLRTGQGRREGLDELKLLRRLRRRIKTFGLLIILYMLAAFYEEIAAWARFTPKASLLYFGLAVLILGWLLILAAREVRETAITALEGSRDIRQQTMEELEKEIERRKNKTASGDE